jgi:hypothetical protein
MPQLDQIREAQEAPEYAAGAGCEAREGERPRSRFSGMFGKKDRSPSLGPGDPPRKLKKSRGVV